ncbi:MAG: lysophospholipid acyltransferase family protein [Verrucomicrobiota bacterium]
MLHEPLLRFEQTNRHYERLLQVVDTPGRFFDQGLGVLGVTYEVSDEDRGRIPREGPLVTVSNHPYGGVDGLVLGSLLDHRRGDVKLLVNYLLGHIEPFRPHIIEVDPFAGEGAKRRNFGAMRESLRWLREGHSLGLFPSGTVSHYHWRQRQITDPAWAANLAGLIRRSGATVVPVYFEGGNSRLFQLLGLLHPRLRTVLLAGEMMRGKERCIRLRVGSPISPSRLQRFASDEAMMGFLRLKTYILQNRSVAAKTSFRMSFRRRKPAAKEPLAPPVDPASMAAEVDALPVAQRLVESGDFLVCYARAEQIPQLLEEIGRLREVTFRAVEEGTGFARDLDQFDRYYLHLFLWDARHRALAGAYRLGPTDEILQHPRYRVLFGTVSISKEYQSLSKNLMVMYLKEHTLDPELATKVRARKPPRSRNLGRLDRSCFNESVRDIEDVSALISEIEREERGVPVLLRQYLKLNATMLSFNVDPEFNDCIDGLVLVDLAKTNEKTLRRYMGGVGAEAFYAYHETRRSERLAVEQTAEG